MLPEAKKVAGVIAASAGNHALALSYHGQELGKIQHQYKSFNKIWNLSMVNYDDRHTRDRSDANCGSDNEGSIVPSIRCQHRDSRNINYLFKLN